MRDELDPKVVEILAQGETPLPPFAYFQELVLSFQRQKRRETLCFALFAGFLIAVLFFAVRWGFALFVGIVLGLVWLMLPLSLLPVLKGRVSYGEN